MLIGREREIERLNEAIESKKSEFIAIYGRRRVGKTFMVKETLKGKLCFHHTGLANSNTKDQILNFRTSLLKAGDEGCPTLKNWLEAFARLEKFINNKSKVRRKIIFIDEHPGLIPINPNSYQPLSISGTHSPQCAMTSCL